jgi:serine protease DegS
VGVLAAVILLNLEWLELPGDRQGPASYSDAVAVATPSVVNIYTAKLVAEKTPVFNAPLLRRYTNRGGRQPRVERSLGSGVIMSQYGHIITNQHVIDGAQSIQILLSDGRRASASVVGIDPDTDLALLKTELTGLSAIQTADSDAIKVGDVVMAIGNPYGFGHSVTLGIISGLERYGLQLSAYESYIQTDAAIHLGNSGGALIDSEGRLVGINTLIYTAAPDQSNDSSGIGINLATPSNLVNTVISDLIEYGAVIRGWLGVEVDLLLGLDDQGRTTQSLLVTETAAGGPAERAGIQVGDLIVALDGADVSDAREAMQMIARLRPGDRVLVGLQRQDRRLDVDAIVATRPANSPSNRTRAAIAWAPSDSPSAMVPATSARALAPRRFTSIIDVRVWKS